MFRQIVELKFDGHIITNTIIVFKHEYKKFDSFIYYVKIAYNKLDS
jgi:hypothetical protein